MYENFHSQLRLQKKVISERDFTYRNILREVAPYIKRSISILDIGCGVGTLSYYLAAKGNRVLGTDVSVNAISMAKKNSESLGLNKNVGFRICNFPKQKISGVFDLVLLIEVIEHIGNDAKAIKQASDLVRKGGVLLVSVPSKTAPLYRLGILTKFDRRVGHLRRYNAAELVNLVSKYGLTVKKVSFYEGFLRNLFYTNKFLGIFLRFVGSYLSDVISFIDSILAKYFGSSQIVLVATKK